MTFKKKTDKRRNRDEKLASMDEDSGEDIDKYLEKMPARTVSGDIVKEKPRMDDPFADEDMGLDMDKMFQAESQGGNDNVKELFHEDKVKARTDLSPKQIANVTKAYYLAKISGMPEINAILNDFITLRISKDRKSRAEFVEGLKAKIEQGMNRGLDMRGQFGK